MPTEAKGNVPVSMAVLVVVTVSVSAAALLFTMEMLSIQSEAVFETKVRTFAYI